MIEELQIHTLETLLIDNISCLEKIIKKYGVLKSLENDTDDNSLKSNFLFYCLTKGLRSLKAAYFLSEKGFFEDIFILLRASFESYLYISFIKKNPNQIHRFTTFKFGIQSGKFQYPKNKNDRDIKHKIIIDNKEYVLELSLHKIAKNTLHKIDSEIYEGLYNYLSQYSHINAISMEHYVSFDTKKFLLESQYENKIFQSIILLLLISWLLLDATTTFEDFDKKDNKRIKSIIKTSGSILRNYVLALETKDEKIDKLIDNILIRIDDVLNLTKP